MKYLIQTLCLATSVLGLALTSPPSGCLVVSKSATSGEYSTVQSAVNALSTTSTSAQCIFIYGGTYTEQVLVSARSAASFTIYGYSENTDSYPDNVVTITYDGSVAAGDSDDSSGTLRVKANNFKLYNVNVVNSYGTGSQAIALSAYATSGYYGCSFIGFQDTVLAEEGTQIYANSLIEGATDFIFGQYSPAWFQSCDIRLQSATFGTITANGRVGSSGTSYYVFDTCTIAAKSGATVPSGAYYLGRPWSEYARVVFQKTSMTDVINSAGWVEWSSSTPNTEDVLFGEYDNSGAGSEGTRASFATKLSSPVLITTILGSDYTSLEIYDNGYFGAYDER